MRNEDDHCVGDVVVQVGIALDCTAGAEDVKEIAGCVDAAGTGLRKVSQDQVTIEHEAAAGKSALDADWTVPSVNDPGNACVVVGCSLAVACLSQYFGSDLRSLVQAAVDWDPS